MAIPNDVLLAAWSPFGAACLFCLLMSLTCLWMLSFVNERKPVALVCGTVTLVVSLATVVLLLADVSLVSAMKGSDGTFLPWAANASERLMVRSQVQLTYHVLYMLLVFLVVVVLPFAFMFLESEDNLEDNAMFWMRVTTAIKYAGLIMVSSGLLLALGELIPMRPHPLHNSTDWDKIRFLFEELAVNREEDSLCFPLSLFTLLGMGLLIVYTGFGLSALPLRLILGKRSNVRTASNRRRRHTRHTRSDSFPLCEAGPNWRNAESSSDDSEDEVVPRRPRTAVSEERLQVGEEGVGPRWRRTASSDTRLEDIAEEATPVEEQLQGIEEGASQSWQRSAPVGQHLQDIEEEVTPIWRYGYPLRERRRNMEAQAVVTNWLVSTVLEEQLPNNVWELHIEHLRRAGCLYRLCFPSRPVQIVLGIVAALLGLLLWTSLLLSNVDKAMHSLGHRMGYVLPHPTLPNPLDLALVELQRWSYGSLDWLLVLALLLLLVACTIYGLQRIGIYSVFVRMYRLDVGLARPQTLLVLCFTLVFVALALNVLMYSVCPQYATYGSQLFQGVNGTQPCDANAPPEECVMSRSSAMLVRFFFKAWAFGAAYYWATWLFLGSTVVSFFVVICCQRSSVQVDSQDSEDDESDSDDSDSEEEENKAVARSSSLPAIRRFSETEPEVAGNLSL